MAKNANVHVVPHEGRWRVEVEGSSRARSTHQTQSEAQNAGRVIARRNKAELLVHGRNGKIRDKRSYGRDPRNVKG